MDISNMAQQVARQVADFQDTQVKQFMKKNLIPYDNIHQAQFELKERGLRLIDEVETIDGQQYHTLLLLKVLDEARYTINHTLKVNGEQL